MRYFIKTPWFIKKIWPGYTWSMPDTEKKLYLTFDDGPHPQATPFVLDELKKWNAKATFFCIGKNVVEHSDIYSRIIEEGHSVGNHTHHHLNGWKTNDEKYLKDFKEASTVINSRLFRPPYGRIKLSQAKQIKATSDIIMWSVLSGDFDKTIKKENCLENVMKHSGPGSIVVFHDSEKAFPVLQYVLPRVLEFFSAKGFVFEKL